MVSRLETEIGREIGNLPIGSLERAFLQREREKFQEFLLQNRELAVKVIKEKDLPVVEAWAIIQEMVKEDNLGKSPLSEETLESNIKLQKSSLENSVARLLPAEWRGFARTVNSLRRSHIDTKERLIIDIFGKSGKIRTLGSKTMPFVFAMRDLAQAEIRAKSSSTSTPQV